MTQLVYTSLLLTVTLCFTCGERKVCSTIKKSENIKDMVLGAFLLILCFKDFEKKKKLLGSGESFEKPECFVFFTSILPLLLVLDKCHLY